MEPWMMIPALDVESRPEDVDLFTVPYTVVSLAPIGL